MKSKKLFLTFLIMAFVFCGLIFPQETKEESKTNKEVVSAQSLSKETNAEDMGEALKTIPGVYIRSGQINIRDATSNKILILIDGQRMNNAQSGGYDVTTIPIDAIETVEVLRGGNSARYGSDAIGGVVNFITKKAKEESHMDLGLRATFGSFNSQFYNVYTSNSLNNFNYYLSYKRRQSDGDFKYTDFYGLEKTRQNNYSKGDDGLLKLGYKLEDNSNLLFTGQLGQSETGVPGSVKGLKNFASTTPRAVSSTDNSYFNLNYNTKEIFGKADLNANSYYQYSRIKYDDPDTYGGPTHSDSKVNAYGLELTQNNPLSDLINLTYGYSYRHDNANSTSIGDKNRNTHGAHLSANVGFKNVEFYFKNISIIPALRYDAPSDFDKVISPKVSFMLASTDEYGLNIAAHWSKSYRAPTFNDLWWPEDAYTVGNPNVKPEDGTTIELGYGITLPFINTQIRMNYFNSDITNQIIWAPRLSDGKWTPSNVDKSLTSGLESYIGVKFFDSKFKVEVNHTYMDARDKSGKANDGKLLFYRPYHKVDLNTALAIDIFEFNINYQFLSKRFVDAANTASLPDVSRWNLNLSVNPKLFDMKWTARLDFNNIFNKDYRLNDGYPLPGREVRMTIGLSLL
ncbi:MAG: TonB-dependent receptor [Ignavibacteriales bacterium]|nr:TonB-dependent receptor [Ignavibacteriales bacterium]